MPPGAAVYGYGSGSAFSSAASLRSPRPRSHRHDDVINADTKRYLPEWRQRRYEEDAANRSFTHRVAEDVV